MEDGYCNECKSHTVQVYDRSAGDTICSECGLVLESRSIDESAEWRTFTNQSDEHDPVRVGNPADPLLTSGGLGTVIAVTKPNSSSLSDNHHLDDDGVVMKKWQNNKSNGNDGYLISAFKRMDEMGDNLGLVPTIMSYAKELFKKANDEKIFVRLKYQIAIMAACFYLACHEQGFPRTLKEICSVADGAKVKDINKAMEALKKQLEVGRKTIHAKDIARRYCSNLGLNNQIIKAVQETVEKSEEFDVRRTYTSVLAATIFMVTQLSDKKIRLKEIAEASEVGEATLRKAYRDLCPYASDLIPNWYADADQIKKLKNI